MTSRDEDKRRVRPAAGPAARSTGAWRAHQTPAGAAARGFTLIELLMVVGIIAILAAMLLPALIRARAMAHTATCTNNQKQLGVMVAMYVGDWDEYMPRSVWGGNGDGDGPESDGLIQKLMAMYPQLDLQVPTVFCQDLGFEARLIVAGLVNWEDGARLMRCPADPRRDWWMGCGAWNDVGGLISKTSLPVAGYIAAPCWGIGWANAGGIPPQYLDTKAPWGGSERADDPMPQGQLLGRRSASDELLFLHASSGRVSLYVNRPQLANEGEWEGWWSESHPFGLPPNSAVQSHGLLVKTSDASTRADCVDLAGWGNPYACVDGHVEYQENIWHDNNLWHQEGRTDTSDAYLAYPNGRPPYPGDLRSAAMAAH